MSKQKNNEAKLGAVKSAAKQWQLEEKMVTQLL